MDKMPQSSSPEAFLSFLQQEGAISGPSAHRISSALQASGQPFDTVVTELGLLRDQELANLLNGFLGHLSVEEVSLHQMMQTSGTVALDYLKEQAILPLAIGDAEIILGVADPFATPAIEALAFYYERAASLRALPRRTINEHLAQFELGTEETNDEAETSFAVEDDLERLKDFASEAPIVRFVTETIARAVEQGATDIHIEPLEDSLRIRYRHDGILSAVSTVPLSILAGVSTRIKILSRLNIAERRLPQDGRMRVAVRGRDVDLRVSVVPSVHGETIVLRILDRATIELQLDKLGFNAHAQQFIAGMC